MPLITARILGARPRTVDCPATGDPGNNLILRPYAGIGSVQPLGSSTVITRLGRFPRLVRGQDIDDLSDLAGAGFAW